MTTEELKALITGIDPNISFEEGSQFPTVNLDATKWHPFAQTLRNHPELNFDYLFCLTCVDWKTHFTMVYHLSSTSHRKELVVKCNLDKAKPEIESVCDIWRTAEFHEREQYELFGVNFLNHPDLRLLILPDGWEGKFPLRKDFEDPVNMIKL